MIKFILKRNVQNKWIQFILEITITIIVALLLFPFFDYIYSLITKTQFEYSIHNHVQDPIIYGTIFGLITFVASNIFKKKKDD